jgi:hypothetical protein
MQVSSKNSIDVDFDVFNYRAIQLLELLGKLDPPQLEIDLVENNLKEIFQQSNMILPQMA